MADNSVEERRRLLTKVADIPLKLMLKLATDKGTEGLKVMLHEDNWEETKSLLATIVHLLAAAGNISGTNPLLHPRWSLLHLGQPVWS